MPSGDTGTGPGPESDAASLFATKTSTGIVCGSQVGPYRIESVLGAGGMGHVYRAVDTRLDRVVAIKFCREEFSERFQREARAIAALNHPHICTLHDVGRGYLVMEHVEGRPLKGPMPLEKVIEYGSQICDALDAAHRKGIVHRDLKPSNILLTRSGVKVLDFGLAKLAGDETLTQAGVVLGTPAYMAPEQRHGIEADQRSDIFALGCVIYEMFTGERTQLKTLEPAALDRVVKTCMAADPEERWQSAREVKLALELAKPSAVQSGGVTGGLPVQRRSWRAFLPWLIAAVAVLLAIAAVVQSRPTQAPGLPALSTVIPIPPDQQLSEGVLPVPFDVSMDGSKLVYVALEAGRRKLFLRLLDQFDVKALPGTEDASTPFFSPDGRWVGFFVQNRLFKVAVSGGSPVLISAVKQGGAGACWTEDGTIIHSSGAGLFRVPSDGGESSQLTVAGPDELSHVLPRIISGTPLILFTINRRQRTPGAGTSLARSVGLLSLKENKHGVLIEGTQAAYLPGGWLVYANDDVLRAASFDLASRRISGSPFTLLDDVYTGQGNGQTYYRLTPSGMLVYVPGRNEHSLARVDRAGHTTELSSRRAGYRHPRLSKNGRFVAVTIDPPDEGDSHVWVLDLDRGAFTKLTRDSHNLTPVISNDGARIAWSDWSGGPRTFWQASDGSGERERLGSLERTTPSDFSPDGKYLLQVMRGPQTRIWALPLNRNEKPFPLTDSKYSSANPRFSPDGKWIVYSSDESGRSEIYVRRFPQSDRNWIVSTGGGTLPAWSHDGKEIFYLEGRKMMAVKVLAGAQFSASKPALLFDRPELTMANPAFDVMGDGFLMVQRDPLSMLTEFRVVQNWPSQWKR